MSYLYVKLLHKNQNSAMATRLQEQVGLFLEACMDVGWLVGGWVGVVIYANAISIFFS